MEPSSLLTRVSDASDGRAPSSYPMVPRPARDRYGLHLLLFLLTLVSTAYTISPYIGRETVYQQSEVFFQDPIFGLSVGWPMIVDGLRFALALLFFLTVHEFGHYFAARVHRISTSLPYYIPSPLIGIGTLGAVIRIREPLPSERKLFDVGAAGPIAGFIVALGVLLYALATLPPPEYMLDVGGHEALTAFIRQHGRFPETMLVGPEDSPGQVIVVGQTPLYWVLSKLFADVPPMYEMYHYPILFAGWLGLFFTALNLMPVGQLDGGHILYALVGPKWHLRLARGFAILLLISVSIGFVDEGVDFMIQWRPGLQAYINWLQIGQWFMLAGFLFLVLNRIFKRDVRLIMPALVGIVLIAVLANAAGPALTQFGWMGWVVWCLLLVFLVRVEHPPVLYSEPLTPRRRALAILSMIIFILCFSIKPLYLV
ncbi:MAG: site-2 protease family protein [Rhodothermales bacterium]